MDEMGSMYDFLGLDGFTDFASNVAPEIEKMSRYRQNEYPPLEEAFAERLRKSFPRQFEEWGYLDENSQIKSYR